VTAIPVHDDLDALSAAHDGFLVDVWGVIHDGRTPFPGVIDALRHLAGIGRPVVLLSNASRPADALDAMLGGMGIGRGLYAAAVTSGEACKVALARHSDPWLTGRGRRCYYIGDHYDLGWIDAIGLERVGDPLEADFVLLTSIEEFTHPLSHYEPALSAAARRDLPLFCANPDRRVVVAGAHRMGSGTLGDRYEALGGRVRWYGKPYPGVYDLAAEHFAVAGVTRPLAIGDALETDILGAHRAGLASALIPGGGVHRRELGIGFGEVPPAGVLAAVCREHGVTPDVVLAAFRFSGRPAGTATPRTP
jgi:HAD superfamily hydrolase (TIGR01459 family)